MPDLVLVKEAGNVLLPCDEAATAFIARCQRGQGFTASVRLHNNPAFHRKMMALFKLAFDAWEPPALTFRGEPVGKNFDAFRKDLTILAGYFDTYVNARGRVRVVARSLNFSTMEQDEREAVYSAVIDVILTRILTNYGRADLDDVVAQTLEFAR